MAEGIFKKIAKNIEVSSAGLMVNSEEPVSENAVIACKEYNVDISSHKAQQITKALIASSDYFVCMTENHTHILINAGVPQNMICTLNVSDPYGGSVELYKKCCKEIYNKLLILKEQLVGLEQ